MLCGYEWIMIHWENASKTKHKREIVSFKFYTEIWTRSRSVLNSEQSAVVLLEKKEETRWVFEYLNG